MTCLLEKGKDILPEAELKREKSEKGMAENLEETDSQTGN
jgi:hypothetical protein